MSTTGTPTEPSVKDAATGLELNGTQTWAICCSGGGIRSASYCLGALQGLEEAGLLGKARLILGVSGGSYIAASRALVAHGLEQFPPGPGADPARVPAYAPGSPEEQHLRDNSRYLAPDAKTVLAGVLSLLFGVAVTLILVLTPLFVVAHVWGWVVRAGGALTYTVAPDSPTPQWAATLTGTAWWIWPVIAAAVTAVIFLWWWVTLIPGARGQEHSNVAVKALGWAAFVTLSLALAMFAVPAVIAWLSGSHAGALKTVLDDLGFGAGAAWSPAAIGTFVAAVIAVSQSARKILVKYDLLKSPEAAQGADAPKPGVAAKAIAYLRGLLLPWLASILVVAAFAVVGLRWVRDGAAAGFTAGQAWLVIGALAVMLIMRFLADANRISLHDFYRWRLATAYSVIRDTSQPGGKPAPFGTKDFPEAALSGLSGQLPKLVMCTTANINAYREVPPGRGGLSFSFDPDRATLRGPGPRESVQASTVDYEALVGRHRFTLFDVSAISGAAFSPLMGAATLQAYRILFTATDLRLGVWLPHPAVVQAARAELDAQKDKQRPDHRGDHWWHAVGLLLRYAVPHPTWQREDKARELKEARLWAYVLKLRSEGTRFQQFLGGLLYHALQPTLGMLYAEAVGHTSYRSTWMCVTDGGHYDNLGLVEALQRAPELGITHILVLDASGDKANTWFTLGGSIAVARSDAGTEVVLNPTQMITPPGSGTAQLVKGQVVQPWASGTFTGQDPDQDKTILVCKLGWWTGAPWDVRAYAAGHPAYPTASTLEQLYDSAEFDAYRELGAAAVKLALQESRLSSISPSRRSASTG
jgi:hypothetical protein